MTAQELKLDYFNIYDVANQQAGYVIGLQGQFDKQPERAQLTCLNLFANPASKNGEPVYDKSAHLTWYGLYDPTPDPTREVTHEDQFGAMDTQVVSPLFFTVPIKKWYEGRTYGIFNEKAHLAIYRDALSSTRHGRDGT